MSRLRIYPDQAPSELLFDSTDHREMAAELGRVGVSFEQWDAGAALAPDAGHDEILAAYAGDVARLKATGGYVTVDVMSLRPDHPDRAALRQKFLSEHTHSEDEVRFFVQGSGTFSLHIEGRVLDVLCTQGDLISVPRGTPHWFDMGPRPSFVAIRLFNDPAGWVASFTGSDIAARFPRHEASGDA